ncbi:DUF4342 domain-containing protein [Pelagibacterium sp.]|uniref:DUF4342 domain-containing protein n=1 Tax=Pelagibacterium sp. TaxID=1967288 RepID=UPI003BA84B68
MDEGENKRERSFTEEFETAGHQLIARIKELLAEGNVRTLRIKTGSGDVFLEIPLTAGTIAGGVVTLAAPWAGRNRRDCSAGDAGESRNCPQRR